MKTYKFVPFSTPNDIMPPATIIKFNSGAEEVVAFSSDCDSVAKFVASDVVNGDVATLDEDFTITNPTSISLVAYPGLIKKLNLTLAFQDSSVKKIKITLVNPFIRVISRAKEYLYLTKAIKYCKDQVNEKDNIVISQVLGSEGLTFTFLSNDNRDVKLKADVVNIISADADVKSTLQSNSSITIAKTIFYGYRGFVGVVSSGLLEGVKDIVETSPEHINALKNANK